MATSGSADFATSRNEVVKYALLNVGAISQGESPNATQYTDVSFLLNSIVKAWQVDGMPLWAIRQSSFALTATASYTIGASGTVNAPRPLKLLNAFTRELTGSTDLPITLITREEYNSLSSKSSTGIPIQLFYDPAGSANANGTMNLWPIPDSASISTRTCYITYQRPFEDFDSSSDEPDFPQEFILPLIWMLSWAISPSYGITLEERKLWLAEAMALKTAALGFGMEEGSLYIEPQRD